MKRGKHIAALTVLTALFLAAGSAGSFAASLDQNEEIQSVMGDLSALKTATQMYYSDNGNNSRVPSLLSVLRYFDEASLPPDASSLYAVKGGDGGWFVGYRASGLKSDTYVQLEENTNTLGLVGDDLRSPWRRDSAYIWSKALTPAGPSAAPVIREPSGSGAGIGVAAAFLGAAAFLCVINHNHGHHYYSYPEQPWRWRSALMYHPFYRDRFYRRFSRPPLQPRRPDPIFRRPPRLRREPRFGSPRPPLHNPPARRPGDNRRPGGPGRPRFQPHR